MKSFFIIFTVIIGLYAVIASDDWSYWGEHGPTHWPGLCIQGKKQSPIAIVPEDTIKTDLGALKFIRYDFAFSGKITNNGHSVQIQLSGVPISIEGANLPSTYTLEQIHFHWPAEHIVDGNRDDLEVHFVHYNNKYGNVTTASQHENGIAVVASLFKVNNEENLELVPILKATELISNNIGVMESTVAMESMIIPYLFLPKDHTTYYYYDGSLTTPGCQESVMWFILAEKLSLSKQQLNIFKTVKSSNGTLSFNYRPTQDLGERKVYHHLLGYSVATSYTSNLLFVCFSFLLSKILCTK
ncbi:PREDICTED: putative carbonic anhydrase 3 [Habropoda laboriosa]|uniref:putative carbonic anhydrase 3 n=1 Tax=Habropoda laboriosa TaxID=597456 RepID=UPI00083D8260|nr:PREDICTED: putative carbonic anhydrase 3 [Habropoda laboriosa]